MPDAAAIPSNSDRELQVVGSLLCAALLAFTGGGLDAFMYLNHGHVFAAAMTGNAVLLGIAALSRDGHEVLHHALPLVAFAVGILAARLLQDRLKRHAITVGLLCEILTLFALSWLPGSFPELLFLALAAVASAYQSGSFRQFDGYTYNSNFITSNFRTMIDGLYEARTPSSRVAGLRKARKLGLIVACFVAGALAGAELAPRFLNHTLLFLVLPLLAVLVVIRRQAALAR